MQGKARASGAISLCSSLSLCQTQLTDKLQSEGWHQRVQEGWGPCSTALGLACLKSLQGCAFDDGSVCLKAPWDLVLICCLWIYLLNFFCCSDKESKNGIWVFSFLKLVHCLFILGKPNGQGYLWFWWPTTLLKHVPVLRNKLYHWTRNTKIESHIIKGKLCIYL